MINFTCVCIFLTSSGPRVSIDCIILTKSIREINRFEPVMSIRDGHMLRVVAPGRHEEETYVWSPTVTSPEPLNDFKSAKGTSISKRMWYADVLFYPNLNWDHQPCLETHPKLNWDQQPWFLFLSPRKMRENKILWIFINPWIFSQAALVQVFTFLEFMLPSLSSSAYHLSSLFHVSFHFFLLLDRHFHFLINNAYLPF